MLPSIVRQVLQSAATLRHAITRRRSRSSCVLAQLLDDCLGENTERNIVLFPVPRIFPVIFEVPLDPPHVGLVIIMSMSDCICHESDKSNSTTIFRQAHTRRFRRTSKSHVYLFNVLDVIRVEGDNGDARLPAVLGVLYGFSRGKHRQRQLSPQVMATLVLIILIFCPFLSFVSSGPYKAIFEPLGNLILL